MKLVAETDPFAGNPETSQIGSMMLILNQILRATRVEENVQAENTNEQTLRSFFNIPESYVWDRVRMEGESVRENSTTS